MKSNLKIQNIVATASLGTKVPLVKLVRSQANTEYNPEQFPGLPGYQRPPGGDKRLRSEKFPGPGYSDAGEFAG